MLLVDFLLVEVDCIYYYEFARGDHVLCMEIKMMLKNDVMHFHFIVSVDVYENGVCIFLDEDVFFILCDFM